MHVPNEGLWDPLLLYGKNGGVSPPVCLHRESAVSDDAFCYSLYYSVFSECMIVCINVIFLSPLCD